MISYLDDWRYKLGNWMMWFGFIVLVLWLLARSFGFINTPSWILQIPVYAAVIGILGFIIKIGQFLLRAGRFLERFDRIENTVGDINSKMKNLTSKVGNNTKNIERIFGILNQIKYRLKKIELKILVN